MLLLSLQQCAKVSACSITLKGGLHKSARELSSGGDFVSAVPVQATTDCSINSAQKDDGDSHLQVIRQAAFMSLLCGPSLYFCTTECRSSHRSTFTGPGVPCICIDIRPIGQPLEWSMSSKPSLATLTFLPSNKMLWQGCITST